MIKLNYTQATLSIAKKIYSEILSVFFIHSKGISLTTASPSPFDSSSPSPIDTEEDVVVVDEGGYCRPKCAPNRAPAKLDREQLQPPPKLIKI